MITNVDDDDNDDEEFEIDENEFNGNNNNGSFLEDDIEKEVILSIKDQQKRSSLKHNDIVLNEIVSDVEENRESCRNADVSISSSESCDINRNYIKNRLTYIANRLSYERNKKFIGKLVPCIIECYSDDGEVIARTQFDAPEIDGIVNIKTDKHVVPGDIEFVKIIGATEYDLIGEI